MRFSASKFFLFSVLAIFASMASAQATRDQDSKIGFLDKQVSSKDFRELWITVSEESGYPLGITILGGGMPESAVRKLRGNWSTWGMFSNNGSLSYKDKFALSGLIMFVKGERSGSNKYSDEDFKSRVLGLYQCMNATIANSFMVKDLGVRMTGTIEEAFGSCATVRI